MMLNSRGDAFRRIIMSYITTVTGKHFDPVNPDERLIDIYDIAHSLSLIGGNVKNFYSAAQHSIACAKEARARDYDIEVVIGCLLHDACKAYLSDVTRHRKDYFDIEKRLQNTIWKHFIGRELTKSELEQVFEIDEEMRSMEFHLRMPEDFDDCYLKLKVPVDCAFEDPDKVMEEFIDLCRKLIKEKE